MSPQKGGPTLCYRWVLFLYHLCTYLVVSVLGLSFECIFH